MLGSINSIETMGAVDGPGLRCVVFMQGCRLRCKYCENPETWCFKKPNVTPEELVKKLIRYKPYFKNGGGVTFSGGEPICQHEFLTNTLKMLKENGIHTAIDTAGCGLGHYAELLKYVDLVIFDVKDARSREFKKLTGQENTEPLNFLKEVKKQNKKLYVRQVVVPGLHDNEKYLFELKNYIDKYINKDDILKIEFLPYHKLGDFKYKDLGIENPYLNKEEMNKELCNKLYLQFINEIFVK